MKLIKAIALAGVFAFAANAQAQESYAPQQGDFSLEVSFNPFSNNFKTFQINALQGRYSLTDNDALRFGIGFGVNTDKVSLVNEEAKNLDNYGKVLGGSFNLNLGYERNVYSYKRINLYAGAGIGFAYYGNTTTIHSEYTDADNKTLTTEVKYYDQNGNISDEDGNSIATGLKAYTEFTVNAFTGIDFFVYKGLYVGAELGLKLGVKSFPAGKIKTTAGNETNEVKGGSTTSAFVLGTYAEPALRLGWKF